MKQKAYIFDLDHTLCYPVNRGPYGSGSEDDSIFSTMHICDLLCLRPRAIKIIILSGRKEKDHLEESEAWLVKHRIDYDEIYLNPTDPCTSAYTFKRGKLKELKEQYTILGVFDDDPDVVIICQDLDIPSFLFTHNL